MTNGDKGGGGSKIVIFTMTYFLNGPYAKANTKSIANANTSAYTNAKCKSNAKARPQTRKFGQHEAYDLQFGI